MNIILEKLYESDIFINFDPFLLNSHERYRTNHVNFHIIYNEDTRPVYSIPVLMPDGTFVENLYDKDNTQNFRVYRIVNEITNNLYKYIIQQIESGQMPYSKIEKIIEPPYSFKHRINEDIFIPRHSPFIIHDFNIKKVEGYNHTENISFNSYHTVCHNFEVSLLYSFVDNIIINKLLTVHDEIKLFKRHKIVDKLINDNN